MLSWELDCHPNWRDRYHVDDLDKMLEILEILNGQSSNLFAVNQWPNTGEFARERRDHSNLNKPLPSSPSTSDGTGSLQPSPNSIIFCTPTNSSHTAGTSSHTTSPTNTSQASASPTSPYSGTLRSSVVGRRACSKGFKGTLQDTAFNLRRHLNKPLPLSPSTSDGAGSLQPSPNSIIFCTPTNSSHTAGTSSHTTSPTNTSQASASPTSPYSGTTTSSVVRCSACCKEFKGNPQDATSNYRRHLKNSRRHNKDAGLKCPMPGCENKNSQRSDNLGPHLQNFHKIASKSERQNIIKATKLSAKRLDSNGRPRRMSRRESMTDSMTLVDE